MKMSEISIIIGVLGTIPKDLKKRMRKLDIRGRIETPNAEIMWNIQET